MQPLAPWLAELAANVRLAAAASAETETRRAQERRRREARRSFLRGLPAAYRWAHLGDPLLAKRVALDSLPTAAPAAKRVVFLGPAGAGKTSLAVALLRAAFERALVDQPLDTDDEAARFASRWHFAHAHRLGVARLQHAAGDGDALEVEQALRARVLIIDDLGNERPTANNALPDVLIERHAEQRATWITTGLSVNQIAERYGGGVARRIFEEGAVLRLEGASR